MKYCEPGNLLTIVCSLHFARDGNKKLAEYPGTSYFLSFPGFWNNGGTTAPYFFNTCCNLTFLSLPTFFFLNAIRCFFTSIFIKTSIK